MLFGNYNSINKLEMNNMLGMNMIGCNNPVSQLFSGTNSIFNTGCYEDFNFFGNNCSPFTYCNGSMNYKAMAGWSVANTLFGIGVQALTQAKAKKQDYSTKTVQADIKEFDKQIQDQVDKLGCKSASEALEFTVETKYQTDINTAKTNKESAKASLADAEKIINKYKEKKYADLTPPEKTEYDDAVAEKKQLTTDLAEGGKYDKAIKTAEEAKKAREAEIEKIKDEIRRLQNAKANAQDMLDDKKLNSADGNKLQRTSFEDLNAKFDENGNLKSGQKVSKSDIRAAIKGYRTATNDSEKEAWKAKFEKLWVDLEPEDRTADLRDACRIICG